MTKTNNTKNKIGIIVGGIGGLTMALTLKRNNLDFKIFEKSNEFTEVGAGIGMSSNALKVFDKLNIGDQIRKKGHFVTKTILAAEKLKVLKEVTFPEKVYSIHRASIIEVISNELDKGSFELNKELVSIENNETVKINFKDNTSCEFSTIIASDGINSTIRKSIFPEIKIRETHQVIWRGITEFDINSDLKHTYYELFEGKCRFLFLPLSETKIFWLAVQEKKEFYKRSLIKLDNNVLNFLGKISYGVYMYHMLIIFGIILIFKKQLASIADVNASLLFYFILTTGVIFVSFISKKVFEDYFLSLKGEYRISQQTKK